MTREPQKLSKEFLMLEEKEKEIERCRDTGALQWYRLKFWFQYDDQITWRWRDPLQLEMELLETAQREIALEIKLTVLSPTNQNQKQDQDQDQDVIMTNFEEKESSD
ncbi:hypothetical protein N7478_005759 [Penicillium angulare]|uniref:uncharacterized protein n=1 Tax=Penicillium angulare TaxID=116970 RepID=UPI0025411358|nr:uncharacterized protein N7478_005759 [Penicillium angulare]KAJ5280387.1 hypothetical protein N7478_005759 [Penicillium angulare]